LGEENGFAPAFSQCPEASSLPPKSSFSFMGGVAERKITKLGCEKHYGAITY